MATTAQQTVTLAKSYLTGGLRERLNFLASSLSKGGTSLTCTDAVDSIKAGMYIEIDLEMLYVRTVNTSTKVLTVRRGMEGTSDIAHSADATVVVNPLYSTNELFRHLQSEVSLLNSSGICWFEAIDITFDATKKVYDLIEATGTKGRILDVHDVTYESDVAGTSGHRPTRFRVHRNRSAADFASEIGLEILEGGSHGHPLRVVVKRSMTPPSKISDDLDVPEHAVAALAPGVAWRMLLGQEARRTNPRVESGSRQADEVPVQSNAFAARAFQSMREDAIAQALEVQLREYPIYKRD